MTDVLLSFHSVLSNYLIWNVIQDEVPFLSKPYRDARTRYKDSVLGSKGQKKRWKTCVSYANELTGDIVGAAYVRKNFEKQSKQMVRKEDFSLQPVRQHSVRCGVVPFTLMNNFEILSIKARDMIVEVREAFKQNVHSLKWMDEATKSRVFEKVQ